MASGELKVLSHDEMLEYAETTAQQLLGVDWATALAMLRAGELGHSVAQCEVYMCAQLLGIDPEDDHDD